MTGFAYPDSLSRCTSASRPAMPRAPRISTIAYLPLIAHEQQPGFGLALRKEMLRRRGAIACAAARQPGPRPR